MDRACSRDMMRYVELRLPTIKRKFVVLFLFNLTLGHKDASIDPHFLNMFKL